MQANSPSMLSSRLGSCEAWARGLVKGQVTTAQVESVRQKNGKVWGPPEGLWGDGQSPTAVQVLPETPSGGEDSGGAPPGPEGGQWSVQCSCLSVSEPSPWSQRPDGGRSSRSLAWRQGGHQCYIKTNVYWL